MKKYINLSALLLVIGLCSVPLWAQFQGIIRGVVKDQQGKPMAGATVQLYDSTTGRKYELKTNSKGEYSSIGIAVGTYKITLLQNGNPVDERNNVPIAPGESGTAERVIDFDLSKTAPGGATLTEEQRKKVEAAQKTNEKIKGLNASLKQAKELEGAGNYDQAITVLQQAAQADPNQDLVWAYLGDAQSGGAQHATDPQVRTKDYQDAVESLQKAIAINGTSATYMALLANAYAHTGQPDKAVEQYKAAAQADPTGAAKYDFNAAAVYYNNGKMDEAIALLDKSIQLDPKRADAYFLKGQAMLGKATTKDNKMVVPEGTAECLNKYLELEPNGKNAEAAKQMLAIIGAPVETTYGKSKSSGKKKPD